MTNLALVVLSLVSILLHGYYFSTGDQAIYVPFVAHRLNPLLFTGDYITRLPENRLSLFFPFLSQFIEITGLDIQWTYFVLYLLFHILFTWSIYRLSLEITGQSLSAWLATIWLMVPRYVGGTTISTLDSAWLPRFFILPVFLLTLGRLYSGQYNLATICISVIALFHPFTALALGIFLIGFMIWDKNYSQLSIASIIMTIPLAWLSWQRWSGSISGSDPMIMPQDWLAITENRLPYVFLHLWEIPGWASLILTVCLLITSYFIGKKLNWSATSFILRILIVSGVITLVQIIGGEILHLTPILQLQLLRIWVIPTFVGFIVFAKICIHWWRYGRGLVKPIAVGLIILITINFGKGNFFTPIEFPNHNNRDWDLVQKWARTHTSPSDVFLIPPHRIGFRILSQRPIVAEIKDGSSGLYSYKLAKDWQQLISELHPLSSKTTAEIMALKQKYSAKYFVTFADQPHPTLPEVFRATTLVIYQL